MKKVILIIFIIIFFNRISYSGEITDTEWTIFDDLIVTYYTGGEDRVNCTAYNSNDKPIGGGFSYTKGGVARVRIDVPDKYEGKALTVKCRTN